MSESLLELVKSFMEKEVSADRFSRSYMELWKVERDTYLLQKDDKTLSQCLSSIFCLADLYNPDPDRESYELDENLLRARISELLTHLETK
jgi:hypothetical protein